VVVEAEVEEEVVAHLLMDHRHAAGVTLIEITMDR